MAICSTLFKIRHSPKILQPPWTKGLVEVKIRILETYLWLFLLIVDNCFNQVHFFPYAHNLRVTSACLDLWKSFSWATACSTEISISSSSKSISLMKGTLLFWFHCSFSLVSNGVTTFVSLHKVRINFNLVFLLLKQQCCKFVQKYMNTHLNKRFFLHTQCETHPILRNHYHWNHLFHIKILKPVVFWMNWNHFILMLSKAFRSLWSWHLNFWYKMENF